MAVVVIEPANPLVDWSEAEVHLRLDNDDNEQPYVEALIAAAQQWIDGPGGWLGRAVGQQTLEWSGDCLPDRLPYAPVRSLVSVTVDGDAVEGGSVTADGRLTLPDCHSRGATVVRYVAGYAKPPAPIKQAMLLLIGQWYLHRENIAVGQTVAELPMAVEALLSPYRVWSV